MTTKTLITESSIPALESRFAGQDRDKIDTVYWDAKIAGFGLRFRRGGKRTFVLQYKFNGADKRMTLGQYPGVTTKKARQLAQKALGEKAGGKDPQADRRAAKAKSAQETLAELIDRYLVDKKPDLKPVTFYEAERYLRKAWKPLHGFAVDDVELSTVAKILDRLKHESGKTTAARARGALSAVYSWAMQRGRANANPVIGTANPDPHTQGERVLSNDELRALWNATGALMTTIASCGF
jgi:hypothetical protein